MDFWHEIEKNAEPKYKERFVVKVRGGIQFIETSQISYFQINDGTRFALDAAGNRFPLNENLNNLEQILDPNTFFRINRSEIVNLNPSNVSNLFYSAKRFVSDSKFIVPNHILNNSKKINTTRVDEKRRF